ncbi:lysophospholipid acyltransferase family protein [Alteribacter lacisalsi]|uniref:lysophospholipid acyltransferase family protein n=1 Tax=Alteribacter lacisalsi TaxID=2045244 RepID=UPI002286EE94|nr:lysophospholipid acyltransferase family protein [Alteribacter lacisalsi]
MLKKHFHHVSCENNWRPSGRGALFLINHSSWWDSLVLFQLNRELLRTDGYALMSEEGLRRFPFFRKIGAFPVNAASYTSVLRSLKEAAVLLNSGKCLFLFPQGDEFHLDIRPLQFQSGAAFLLKEAPHCDLVPVTFYHTLLHEQHPEFFIRVGSSLAFDSQVPRKELTIQLENQLTEQLDGLKNDVMNEKTESFRPVVRGRETIGDRWYSIKQSLPRLFGRAGR